MDYNKPNVLNISTGDLAMNFKLFANEVRIYLVATETVKKSREVQVARLKNLLGSEALRVYNAITTLSDEHETIEGILEVLKTHCTPKRNEAMCIFRFLSRKQSPSEPFDAFYAKLRELVEPCEFGNQEDKLLRTQIVLGLNSNESRQRLLREDPTLAKVVQFCQSVEAADKNLRVIAEKQVTTTFSPDLQLNAVQMRGDTSNLSPKFRQGQQPLVSANQPFTSGRGMPISNNRMCPQCGYFHTSSRPCPATNAMCMNCGKLNHFARVCKVVRAPAGRRNRSMNELIDEESFIHYEPELTTAVSTPGKPHQVVQEDALLSQACYRPQLFIDNVNPINDPSDEQFFDIGCVGRAQWHVRLLIDGKHVVFKVDTGAEVNVIPMGVLRSVNPVYVDALMPCTQVLIGFGGFRIYPTGKIELIVDYQGKSFSLVFLVVDSPHVSPILSCSTCEKLDLLERKFVETTASHASVQTPNLKTFVNDNIDVFSGVGCFPDTLTLQLKPGAIPKSCPARRVPFKLLDRLKLRLDELESLGIIEKCEAGEWVNNLVIVEKHKTGDLRLCIDPQQLNKFLVRDYVLIPTVDELTTRLLKKKVFCVFDLKDGFYQVKLDPASSKLCSFSSPFGVYRFLRAPFGLSVLPEYFQKMTSKIFGGIQGVSVYFDDLLCAAETEVELWGIVNRVVDAARKNCVVLNPTKVQFFVRDIRFLGLNFNESGIQPDKERIKAIMELENPSSKKDLMRILGTVNYLRSFIPRLSELVVPFRDLLKKNVEWGWSDFLSGELAKLKEAIANHALLTPFDPSKAITVHADSSQFAVGCALMQEGNPVIYASRSLTETEQNYAQIEKELLSVVFAFQKFHNFVYGHNGVIVCSDHSPLTTIISKDLHKITNNRLRRLRLKLLPYTFTLNYLPGKDMHIADLLSRNCHPTKSEVDMSMFDMVHVVSTSNELAPPIVSKLQAATSTDATLQQLFHFYVKGWPKSPPKSNDELRHYWSIKSEITVCRGLLYVNECVIVPVSMRRELLGLLHETHLSLNKMKDQARTAFYWPGMMSDLQNLVVSCSVCNKFQRNKIKNPLQSHHIPEIPFYKVAADIADFNGRSYLVLVDFYSRWIEVEPIPNKSAGSVVAVLKPIFGRFGIPNLFFSDNVPFNSFEFKQFASQWNFTLQTSSPHYPRSNGLAEKAVGIVKSMLLKSNENGVDFQLYLLNYRNSCVANLPYSPAQLIQSRRLNSKLPSTVTILKPSIVSDPVVTFKLGQNEMYNRTARVHEQTFSVGDSVYVRNPASNHWEQGVIKANLDHRSHIVQIGNSCYRRSSQFIRPARGGESLQRAPTLGLPNHDFPIEDTSGEPLVTPRSELSSLPGSASGQQDWAGWTELGGTPPGINSQSPCSDPALTPAPTGRLTRFGREIIVPKRLDL